jgi:hypothetical protein
MITRFARARKEYNIRRFLRRTSRAAVLWLQKQGHIRFCVCNRREILYNKYL